MRGTKVDKIELLRSHLSLRGYKKWGEWKNNSNMKDGGVDLFDLHIFGFRLKLINLQF